jgi:hypothetical protein
LPAFLPLTSLYFLSLIQVPFPTSSAQWQRESCPPFLILEECGKSLSAFSFVHADENALTPATQRG